MQLTTTVNGYPTIKLDSPLEPFAEFLRAAHSRGSAKHILSTVNSVIAGNPRTASIAQDYAELTLDHNAFSARVLIDNVSSNTEETAEIPLDRFRNMAEAWATFVERTVLDGNG